MAGLTTIGPGDEEWWEADGEVRSLAALARSLRTRARAGRASERSAALLLSSRAAPRSQPLDQADVTSKTLNVEILVAGDGYHYPRMNNLVSVDYVGYLPDGARARAARSRAQRGGAAAAAENARRSHAPPPPPFALPRARSAFARRFPPRAVARVPLSRRQGL